MKSEKELLNDLQMFSKNKFKSYFKLIRVDNWFKNFFVLPGFAVALTLTSTHHENLFLRLILGLISACLVASANYVINEWLDREFDKYHPLKKLRPSVAEELNPIVIYSEYFLLLSISLSIAYFLGYGFFLSACALLIMGLFYNVKPFRTKDRIYLDVLSESVNNPIRLFMGWFVVTQEAAIPISIILAYWMGGAFLMAVKRYSEYRYINNPEVAAKYRRSFKFYTEDRLLISILLYATASALFGGIFLFKHRIELLIVFPLYSIVYGWYLSIGMKPNSAAQHPEHMYQERGFVLFFIFVALLSIACFFIEIPGLSIFLQTSHIK